MEQRIDAEPDAWATIDMCAGPTFGQVRYDKLPIQSLNPLQYTHEKLYSEKSVIGLMKASYYDGYSAFKCIGVIDSEGGIYPEPPEAGTQVFVCNMENTKEIERLRSVLLIAQRFCNSLSAEECPDSVAIPINEALKRLDVPNAELRGAKPIGEASRSNDVLGKEDL